MVRCLGDGLKVLDEERAVSVRWKIASSASMEFAVDG